ncbi:MAG TPA: cytochrome c [Gemmatimonadales bacterium]|jgi:cytochrome c2|nr:cytochrome c [Gemmatimonadales bacterium]
MTVLRGGTVGLVLMAVACAPSDRSPLVPGGSIAAGRAAVQQFSCGTCHAIRGVPGAVGQIGPPLTGIVHRTLIAGEIPNSPGNLAGWIRNPQAYEPRTAMPNLGVSDSAARDMVAFLYSLH